MVTGSDPGTEPSKTRLTRCLTHITSRRYNDDLQYSIALEAPAPCYEGNVAVWSLKTKHRKKEMYCMGTYQAPQVPQPGVTFGDERLVDPWAVTMLQNTCSNLQVQNMALQQENAALKNKSQSLQQQRENPLCKAANRAYLREFTAYKTESLVEFPDGRYYLVKENPLGEPYKFIKPVSDCTEFSARYANWSIHGTALRVLKSSTDFLTEFFQASVLPMTNFSRTLWFKDFTKVAAHSAVEKMVPGYFTCSLRSFWVSRRSIFNLYLGGISTPQDGFSKSRQDVRRHWIVRFFVLMLWHPKTNW